MKIKPWDIVIILTALLIALGGLLLIPKAHRLPTTAIIEQGGARQEIPLPAYEEIKVNGVEIIIEGYTARISHSNCPRLICVNNGTLSRSGQKSVCLPNRVILRLSGGGPIASVG